MPLPLGHAAIGLTAYDLCSGNDCGFSRWKLAFFIVLLANLPDIDVLIGLLFQGNGNAFHRGPTHSVIFALAMGFLASNAWKFWSQIPKIGFRNCFWVIISHVMADFFFGGSQVSFFWPFEVHWANGYRGWGDVLNSVFMKAVQDAPIVMACAVLIALNRQMRKYIPKKYTLEPRQ